MNKADNVRKDVSEAYARAVNAPADKGCCCGGEVATKGAVARVAGYTTEEMNS